MKKVLDNFKDISFKSTFSLLKDFFKRVGAGIVIGLLMAILFGLLSHKLTFMSSLLDRYEYVSYDDRMRYKTSGIGGDMLIDDVVIIDIETSSVAPVDEGGLGRYFNWPHAYHGQMIETVSRGNPKAILFDMIVDPENTFNYDLVNALQSDTEPKSKSLSEVTAQYLKSNDPSLFVKATYNTQKAYHGLEFGYADTLNFLDKMYSEPEGYSFDNHIMKGVSDEAKKRLPSGDRFNNTHVDLLSASVGTGSVTFLVDEDGIIRRAPTAIYFDGADHVYPSLVMSGIIDILGIKKDGGFDYDFDNYVLNLIDTTNTIVRKIPIDDRGRMFVNFYGGFQTFTYIPYMYAMDPELLDPSYWEGKVGIVGASLAGLSDFRNTPVSEAFVGVEIHASAMYSILKNEFISIKSKGDTFKAILILSIIMGIMISFPKKPLYALPIPILGVVAWVVFTRMQFGGSLVMWDVTRTTLSIMSTFVGIFMYNYFGAEKDKRFLKNTFSTYISPELIDQMYDAKEQPSLGGEEGYHTAFFTDIQSFSAFSEKLSAPDLVELLNDYLTEMTDILLKNKGTLDKYIGDAIVAFYGAPAPVEDHEYWSCLTAVRMQEGLAELREKWQSEGERWPEIVHNMQNRIGINTGKLVTGNMGSTMRMNYTMMGDTVNLAARLEASAKQYGVYIQVAEETYTACKDKFIWRDLDYVIVMGKTEPAKVYELISESGNMPPGYDKLLPAYNEAIDLYRNQDWAKAIEAFKASDKLEDMFPGRKTNPSRIYIPRCEHYKENPPGDNWDGSWSLTKK